MVTIDYQVVVKPVSKMTSVFMEREGLIPARVKVGARSD